MGAAGHGNELGGPVPPSKQWVNPLQEGTLQESKRREAKVWKRHLTRLAMGIVFVVLALEGHEI